MRVLVVASDRMEFPGILSHAREARPVAVAVDWARTARLADHDVLLAANGVGAARAAEAVDLALAAFPADAVVSTGFCGALRPELEVADVVIGAWVQAGERRFQLWPVSGAAGGQMGGIRSADHVVSTAEEKRKLAETGACAVEMEAAGVAERAAAHGIPCSCVKAVTDLSGESLMNDFNQALRTDGHFDTIDLLRGTLRQPIVRIRELLRLQRRCVRAARKLGDFFAELRF